MNLLIPSACVYNSHLALAQDPNVEVVFVGNLNNHHFEVTKLMLDHGKHVVVRKPLSLCERQTRELLAYAKEQKLFLMEAIWPRFFPALKYIRKQIADGKLGDIISVNSSFGDASNQIDRLT